MEFHNFLAGIDLAQSTPPGSSHFSAPVQEAIDTAVWLAEKTKAALTFFAAIDVPLDTPYLPLVAGDPQALARSLTQSAQDVLAPLVREAQGKRISARSEVACGSGWVEVLRQVVHRRYDLVIVGARRLHGVDRWLLGSTSRKLLRRCPAPVWITHSKHVANVSNILVASDLQPVAERALQAAVGLQKLTGAELHLVHAVDYPLDRIWIADIDERSRQYHQRVRDDASSTLQQQVAKLGAAGDGVKIEVVDGVLGADQAIMHYIDTHHVDMLVMGTVGRSGLAGVLMGNTAERLINQAPCAVLVVKPEGFQCPLTLEPPAG